MTPSLRLLTSCFLALATLACAAQSTTAQSTPAGASATDVMTQLESSASAQQKGILLQFGASWCGNCKLFDRFLNDPTIHPIMTKAFIFGEMATGESAKDTRHANLPGGVDLERTLGGAKAGWPYIVMLNDKGKLLASSIRPGKDGNIGYPATPDEIGWFVTMLRTAAPALTPQDLHTVQAWLSSHSPVHG